MWTVFKKELREGWLFLMVNVLVLVGTPPLGRLFLPRHWDADVTSIFYAVMFGLFVPLYLVILAAGLVQDENTFLVRGLPVKPWKVAGGKLIYLALNMIVMEFFCLVWYVQEMSWPLDHIQMELFYFYLYAGATAVAALTAFAFASFLPRKSYAIFAALLATILGMGSLLYMAAYYPTPISVDRPIQVLIGVVLLLLTTAAFVLYQAMIRQTRRLWVRAAVVALLLPLLAGTLWLRAPLWLKQVILGNPYNLAPTGNNLFITANRWGSPQDPYLFDAKTGDLRAIPFIGNAEYIVGADPDRSTVYTATTKIIVKEKRSFRKYSALDPISGKTRDLGILPAYSVGFEGDIARWSHYENKNWTFGFKDLVRGISFQFNEAGCRHHIWGPDGVLYDRPGPEGTVWMFVDFATAQPREVLKGAYYSWPWSIAGAYFLFEGIRDSNEGISYDRNLFQWDSASGALLNLGPGRPLLACGKYVVLIRGNRDGIKTLVLYKNGIEVAVLDTDFIGGYPLDFMRAETWVHDESTWKILFWSDKERKSNILGMLSIAQDRLILKTIPLPSDMLDLMRIPGSDDVLLFKKIKSDEDQWGSYLCRVYRLDPATGKMKRLV